MAFQSMMSGSECSTSANPLSQLLKQQQTDRSLHQGPSLQHSGQPARTLRTHSPMQNGAQEAEQFFGGGQGVGGGKVQGGEFPGMANLRREIEAVARQQHQGQGKSRPESARHSLLDTKPDWISHDIVQNGAVSLHLGLFLAVNSNVNLNSLELNLNPVNYQVPDSDPFQQH